MFRFMNFFLQAFKSVFGEYFNSPLREDAAGIDPFVDEVNRDACHRDVSPPGIADSVPSGEGRE